MKGFSPRLLQQPKLSRFIWEAFLRNKTWAVLTFFINCAGRSARIFWPIFIKFMTDELTVAMQTHVINWERMVTILAIGFCCWYNEDMADTAGSVIGGRRLAAMRASIRLFVLEDLYRQPQQFFHDRFAGSISTSMRDLSESVSDILNELVYQFLPTIVLFLWLSVLFFHQYAGYMALMMIWMIFQIGLVYLTKQKAQQKSRDYADKRSELFGKFIDSITNHLPVASFTAQKHEHQLIAQMEEKVIDKREKVVTYTHLVSLVSGTMEVSLVFFGFILMYFHLFQQGHATVGDFLMMILGIYSMLQAVKIISNRTFWLYEQIGIGQDAIRKIIVPRTIIDAPEARPLHVTQAVLQVESINFAYLPHKPVLKDVSFTVQSGEKIGLVGYSGAGKTTLVSLLLRFYDVTSGRILIDGRDITMVTQDSLRQAIAIIPQDTGLFHRSLSDNIRIARPDASDEEVINAARLAGAHDFIMHQVHGYDTLVGERGVKLSGGQRQRIAMARAFLKAAPILVLDEATSALDSLTENSIQDALDKVMAGRTTLVIAHRLSTLRRMDRILVFDHGRIVEQGTHEQLLTLNGRYAQMWAMQAGGFLPEKDPVALPEADEVF